MGPLQEESSRRAAREVEMRRFYNPMAAMAVGEARYDGLEGWARWAMPWDIKRSLLEFGDAW